MTAIKSRHTKPEITVRFIVHRLGFHLHDAKLAGKPDIVFPLKNRQMVNGKLLMVNC